MSYPQTGSTGDGYKFAGMFGHKVTDLYPAETYLVTKNIFPLAGITLEDVCITIGKHTSRDSMLFTHVGLSGPAVQTVSEYVYREIKEKKTAIIQIDLLTNISINELFNDMDSYPSKNEIKTWLKTKLPTRLVETILNISKIDGSIKIASLSKIDKEKLLNNIKNFSFEIIKTGNAEQSFVTGGGIDLGDIDTKTMESKIIFGLYFVGEVLDFHGPIGGYNLTIAFSTGYTAGLSIK
jgi:predicted Rossmann fold flavoprotein